MTIPPNSNIVAWVLILSYCYYHFDTSLVEDTVYDSLCKNLLDNWDNIQHRHKHLIDEGSLRAGTLYHLKLEDYPLITRISAHELMEKEFGHHNGQAFM